LASKTSGTGRRRNSANHTSCGDRVRTIAVAGGAGFLGSHICTRLIQSGHVVICLDDFSTGRINNLTHLFGSERFVLHEHDILEPFPSALPRFDDIYNFACPASPPQYQRDPVRTALICVRGTLHCLERAEADGSRMFHASTSEVYGDPLRHPQDEGYFGNVNPTGPRACYDEGKRLAETLISDYARQSGLDARIARIFNTYGPRMQPNDGRVVSNFIVQALKGEDLTIYGAGHQTRSFCYVDDLADGILRLMATARGIATPINLGNPGETTVAALAELVLELTGASSRLVYRPCPTDDPQRRRPDISKARRELGWRPKVPLREGLGPTIDYFARALGRTGLRPACAQVVPLPLKTRRRSSLAEATP
jgi:UDP-glucuronate decarboxylase